MRIVVLALPCVAASSAVAIGLWKIAWPSDAFWKGHNQWIVVCIFGSALIPIVQTSIAEFGETRRRKKLEREDHVRSLLIPALVQAVRHCNAPWDLTGVQVFTVKGIWWRKRQVRVAKVRLASASESGVSWTKGKGIIGRCWETHSTVVADLSQPPFSELSHVTEERWGLVPVAQRYGLSYSDYISLGSKYGIIAAVPIIADGMKYLGCVTLDMPPGHNLANVDQLLEFLATTADLVRRMLRG